MKSLRHFQKATIKEVAEQAGVSKTTVSLFVKGRDSVCSAETAERIREAISALNYTPSALTRGLHRKASRTIGVCLPHPLDEDVMYGSSFFEQIWRGILHEADLEDYSLLHYPASVRDGISCDAFLDGRVDGLLLLEHENKRSPRIIAAGMPLVMLLRSQDVVEGCSTVYADESMIVDLALSHLWDLGHRRIAHIAGPVDTRPEQISSGRLNPEMPHDDVACRRMEEYQSWLTRRDAFDPQLVGYSRNWTATNADSLLQRLLQSPKPATAVFCANDVQAINIIHAARRRGISVPDDLSVVGVDNSAAALSNDVSLTTVDTCTEEIGKQAVRLLVKSLNNDSPVAESVVTPVAGLVVRNSTRPLL